MRFTRFLLNSRPRCPARPCLAFRVFAAAMLAFALSLTSAPTACGQQAVLDTHNSFGVLRTITLDQNPLDLSNPFFQSLGTNGRSCASCHVASSAWTITPDEMQRSFSRHAGARSHLPNQRWLELAERGRLHAPGPAQSLQHVAHQGPDPHWTADSGGRGVYPRGR